MYPDCTHYTLHRCWPRSGKSTTRVATGLLKAVIKFNELEEAPDNVFNEIVALRLAQRLNVPVTEGVLVSSPRGPLFASLAISDAGISLPDLSRKDVQKCAERYPEQVASLVAFDIWIGNFDRALNVKANLGADAIPVFRAFDHSHCLLNAAAKRSVSMEQLASKALIATAHPFYGLVTRDHLFPWISRIASLHGRLVEESCIHPSLQTLVPLNVQRQLSNALKRRRQVLADIVVSNYSLIFR